MDVTALAHRPATKAASRDSDPRRIDEVARGFESVFFAQLCKQMRETLEPGSLFDGDHGDVFGGLFDQFMGEHLARSGSLGIAAMIRKQLAPASTHEQHPLPPHAAPDQRRTGPTVS